MRRPHERRRRRRSPRCDAAGWRAAARDARRARPRASRSSAAPSATCCSGARRASSTSSSRATRALRAAARRGRSSGGRARRVTVHERFGTATVARHGGRIDVATPARRALPAPGRAAGGREPATLEEDLARRDFTVNAIAVTLGPRPASCSPPTHALEDLAAQPAARAPRAQLHRRSDAPAAARPLRARLGFELEPRTAAARRRRARGGRVRDASPARASAPSCGSRSRSPTRSPRSPRSSELGVLAALVPALALDRALAEGALALLPADGRAQELLLAACCSDPRADAREQSAAGLLDGSSSPPASASASRAAALARRAREPARAAAATVALRERSHDHPLEAVALAGALGERSGAPRAGEQARLARAAAPRAPARSPATTCSRPGRARAPRSAGAWTRRSSCARRRARGRGPRGRAARRAGGERDEPDRRCSSSFPAAGTCCSARARTATPRASAATAPRTAHSVREQLRALRSASAALARGRQVHGTDVQPRAHAAAARVDRMRIPAAGTGQPTPTGRRPRCGSSAPPCSPPTACRSRSAATGAVAMLHAGWRGLAAGVLEEGVRAPCASSAAVDAARTADHRPAAPAPAATRSATRSTHAFAGAHRHGRNLDLTRDRAASSCSARACARSPTSAVHDLRRALLLAPPRRRARRPPGGDRMAALIAGLDAERVRANLAAVRERDRRGRARRAPAREPGASAPRGVLAATKYVAAERPARARRRRRPPRRREPRAGPAGEGRAPTARSSTWDFIGALQSRRVRLIVPHVRLIHSVASDSALRELERHRAQRPRRAADPDRGQRRRRAGQGRGRPEQLDELIARSPVPVAGLMTMPPLRPRIPRTAGATSRRCASSRDERGLEHLSMGTTQDYVVAVEEGATIVRIGTVALSAGGDKTAFRPAKSLASAGKSPARANTHPRSMSLRDSWHRALVYFGLAEEYPDDYYDDDDARPRRSSRTTTASARTCAACAAAATRSTTSSPTTTRTPRAARAARPRQPPDHRSGPSATATATCASTWSSPSRSTTPSRSPTSSRTRSP